MNVKNNVFLLKELVKRDISSRYKDSMIGGVWAFVAPLIMLAVYTFVFSMVFQARWGDSGTSKTAFALNLFVGIILHGVLAESMSRAPTVMQQHASYVKKIIFPLWLLPMVPVISGTFHALISLFVLLLAFWLFQGLWPWQTIFLPLVFLPIVFFALGFAWLIAGIGVYFRDITQIMPMFITVMMFMAPIFYPASAIPEKYRAWLLLNPLTYAVEMGRAALFSGQLPSLFAYLVYLSLAMLSALVGLLFFSKVRKGFADVL